MRNFTLLFLMVSFGFLQAQTDTVTFQVDLNNYTGSFTTANVNGTFNAWCGACNPMTDANSDGIWEVSLPLTAGTIEYKFTLDGWTAQENLTSGSPCTITTSGFTNRALTFSGDTTLGVVCWEQCTTCGTGGGTGTQVALPITFDDPTVAYTTVSFGGNVDSIAPDPTNAANNVLVVNKPMGTQTWAGTTVSAGGLATAIPFTATDNIISVRVWSPDAGVPMRLKVEDANDPTISVETEVNTTQAGAWETLTFDFSAGNQATGTAAINYANTYDMISFFPNFGTDGNTAGNKTYYVDDIMFGSGGGTMLSQVDLPITFDDATVAYTTVSFGGNVDSIAPDPTNAANNVLVVNKPMGTQTWAGTTVSAGGLATAIPFTATDNIISVRVWSPDAGVPMRLKAEDANDPTISVETEATTTQAGAWETLTFDFSAGNEATGTAAINYANTYDMLSFFPNFGTDGNTAGDKTYYLDDFVFGTGGGTGPVLSQVDLPITWEDSTVNYASAAFGGASDTILADPTNAANTVMQITKEGNAQTWAGVTVSFGGLANPVPFTATETTMTVRVWSPDAGVDVLLKVEDNNDGAISVETIATTTMAGAWETLTFDFTNNAANTPALDLTQTYDVVSVFPNFGTDGATQGGPKTFYIDDVMFGAGTIGLTENTSLNAFSFSPNPTNGSFDVRLSLDSPQATLSIINLAGQVMHAEVLSLNGNNSVHHIDAQSLPKGIYLINVSNGSSSHSEKIVIE
jgi:hypothetical protein